MEIEKINKYHNGKIYTIRSPHTNKIYIGSTCQPLHKRLYEHKYKLNTSSKEIILLGDAYIELLEDFKCENREQLHKKEGELIRKNILICVNKCVAGRTKKEWKTDNKEIIQEKDKQYRVKNIEKYKEYCTTNIDKMKEQKKQYRLENCEIIKAKKKQYRIDNTDVIKFKQKQYRIDNLEKVQEKEKQSRIKIKQTFDCECGGKYDNRHKLSHMKSMKHKAHFNIV